MDDKYDADVESYYPEFGIIKVNKSYILPTERSERNSALKQLVAAISKHGLENQTDV